MRTLVIGDIHGCWRGLEQVLERCSFDPSNDKIICLGDTSDGWPDVKKCFDFLMGLDNLEYCIGNHDDWFMKHLMGTLDLHEQGGWVTQGGMATLDSYAGHSTDEVLKFIQSAKSYHLEGSKLFCHGGVPSDIKPEELDDLGGDYFIWDRNLVEICRMGIFTGDRGVENFDEVYVGHTPTLFYDGDIPKKYLNLWMCDTGASYDGKLTIMDINSKEYWQSDKVTDLYEGIKAR